MFEITEHINYCDIVITQCIHFIKTAHCRPWLFTSRKVNKFSTAGLLESCLTYKGFFSFLPPQSPTSTACAWLSLFAKLLTLYMVTVLVSPWEQGLHLVSSHIYPAYNSVWGPHDRLKFPSEFKHSFLVPAFKSLSGRGIPSYWPAFAVSGSRVGDWLRRGCWTFQPLKIISLALSKV